MTETLLSQGQINAGLQYGDYRLGSSQYTYSIPVAGAVWPGYDVGSEPFTSYSVLNPAQAAAFRAAIAQWDALIAPSFSEVPDTASGRGELRAAFTDEDDDTYGYAYVGPPQSPGSAIGDVWINSDNAGDDFSPGHYGFEVLLHELGHTLGLKHSFEGTPLPEPYENRRYTVMSYTEAPDDYSITFTTDGGGIQSAYSLVVPVTPMVADVAAVQAIYGADPTTNSGDTVYRFTQGEAVLQTLYDAGGNDTIDVSDFTRSNMIDLTPGAYSSIGEFSRADQIAYWTAQAGYYESFINDVLGDAALFTFTDDVGIAFSTTIENAIGGSADDTIIGNSVANLLRGNDGNDFINGGDGDDVLDGGNGNDRLDGGAGDDRLIGGGGDDMLTGGDGNDRLDGGQGNDAIYGGSGRDALTGGDGADTFYLAGAFDGTSITDFNSGDAIVLDSPGGFIGSGLFSGVAGQYRSFTDGRETFVQIDVDGDGVADDVLTLTNGAFNLTARTGSDAQLELVAADRSFTLLAPDGLAITVAGYGQVIGKAGVQDVTVGDAPGRIVFDGSFNLGGDRIHFAGNAADYSVVRVGSQVTISDGETTIVVPAGAHGADLVFADGSRTITTDSAHNTISLGAQIVTATATVIDAAAQAPTATGATDPDAFARLVMAPDGAVTIGGHASVFGTGGHESVTFLAGSSANFDGSFNAGGDTIVLAGDAGDYDAVRTGSMVILTSGDEHFSIPIGNAGMTIGFADDARTLFYDSQSHSAYLGDQAIGTTVEPVDPAGALSAAAFAGADAAAPLGVAHMAIDPAVHSGDPGLPIL